ncbi:G5 domain-containing protein [Micromonospora sp. LH3U1]|uniref:G5 domain-containing protein n=1 Tax=Micromonospora sp. LH3U1 TaxID=3018339 RepID=UPI00234AEC43|nr:G5 domain-containing protein [Micromonospora sp. LH3U1]WCN84530.1 G5 domain-containing protein [Micromonospora sp. LH3U1]
MQPPQNPGPPHSPSFGPGPRPPAAPNWFRRASPGSRVVVILGSVALSILLLCCAGTAIVGVLTGEPEPTRTGTAAEAQQPIVAAPAEPAEETPAQEVSPIAAPTTAPPPASPSTSSAAPPAVPVVQVTTVTEQAAIRYGERTVKDPSLAEGKRVIRTKGVNGVRTLTYEVTTTDGVRTAKKLVKSTVTKQAVTQVVAVGTKKAQSSKCDPNYSGCVPIASDVDCAGGSGNGPAYVSGPIRVIGNDIYDLDRDGDGIACD